MPEWLKRLFEKMVDPQQMLQRAYDTLQSELLKVRQQYAQAMAAEAKLEKKLSDKRFTSEEAERLETEFINQQAATQALKLRLETLEAQVQKSYTKKTSLDSQAESQ